MQVIVQKYGGTSLGDITRIEQVAECVISTQRDAGPVVVVVSAMASTTDELIAQAEQIDPSARGRELDALLSTGECASAALLTLAIQTHGVPACSLTGAAAGISTDRRFGGARIIGVNPARVRTELEAGKIVVVTGFQGGARDTGCTTTLGRGGSDATAVALAAALRAEECEIRTDVDGVFTADPRWVCNARKMDRLGYDHMLELAECGTRVLMPRCVEYAREHGVRLHIRSATSTREGTWIGPETGFAEQRPSAQAEPVGIAHCAAQVSYTLRGVPDEPDTLTAVFGTLSEATLNVATATWQRSPSRPETLDVTFTVPNSDCARLDTALEKMRGSAARFTVERSTVEAAFSVVGSNLRSNPTVLADLLTALTASAVRVHGAAVHDDRITIRCPGEQLVSAVAAAHDASGLAAGPIRNDSKELIG